MTESVAAPWSRAEVFNWLIREGRLMPSADQLLAQTCQRIAAAGLPLDRVAVFIWTLHPLYFGLRLLWDGHSVDVAETEYSVQQSEAYRQSPVVRIRNGERLIRRRLADPQCLMDFAVLEELQDQGFADYLLSELVFSDGQRHGVSVATKRASGFTENDIAELEVLLQVLALVLECHVNRRFSQTLLNTYLGKKSGARVLDGTIRRGDGELIDAVIWYCDLRDSTRLSLALGNEEFLAVLNDYFEATAGAVLDAGGEILRFIGDASLAVFAIEPGDDGPKRACRDAVCAANAAVDRAENANQRRRESDKPQFEFGIGLHRGEVLYGNIGTPGRLEFSVIGPAANEAARIEALCKSTGAQLVATSAVLEHVDETWSSLGYFEIRGLDRPLELHAPARRCA
ncbi:MAG: adenylate/guanylate cyclase domain-containing protein [Gammaproteobacteria bacterium]